MSGAKQGGGHIGSLRQGKERRSQQQKGQVRSQSRGVKNLGSQGESRSKSRALTHTVTDSRTVRVSHRETKYLSESGMIVRVKSK